MNNHTVFNIMALVFLLQNRDSSLGYSYVNLPERFSLKTKLHLSFRPPRIIDTEKSTRELAVIILENLTKVLAHLSKREESE